MGTVISVLVIIICLVLLLVILVQNPKGGLASNFSSANQIGGVRRTTDFLEKATWTLGIALVVISIVSASVITRGDGGASNDNTINLQNVANEKPGTAGGPQPAQAPVGGGPGTGGGQPVGQPQPGGQQ